MSKDDEIIRHLMDLKESVGGLNAKQESFNEHLSSVSKKCDKRFDDFEKHREDLNAHGKAAIHASISSWASILALIGAAIAVLKGKGGPHP